MKRVRRSYELVDKVTENPNYRLTNSKQNRLKYVQTLQSRVRQGGELFIQTAELACVWQDYGNIEKVYAESQSRTG